MRLAMALVAATGAAAMGDEVITTFGHPWYPTAQAISAGQTFTAPESNLIANFAFVCKAFEDVDDPTYQILLYPWDEGAQTINGPPLWSEYGSIPFPEGELRFHEIGLLLEAGETYAMAIHMIGDEVFAGVGAVLDDLYDGGSLITTVDPHDHPWIAFDGLDMYFSMTFKSCAADMNKDGVLDIFDFIAFQGAFTAGSMKADCNGDGVLNVLDFVCFQARFQAGCGAP